MTTIDVNLKPNTTAEIAVDVEAPEFPERVPYAIISTFNLLCEEHTKELGSIRDRPYIEQIAYAHVSMMELTTCAGCMKSGGNQMAGFVKVNVSGVSLDGVESTVDLTLGDPDDIMAVKQGRAEVDSVQKLEQIDDAAERQEGS